jgi:sugar lactone lactonase YvrE
LLLVAPARSAATPESVLTEWGDLGAESGQFDTPSAIAVSRDFVYVADFGNHRVQRFTRDGIGAGQWGTYGVGAGQFRGPAGLAIDAHGDVYVSDFYNHRVQKFTADGTWLRQWGGEGAGAGSLRGPAGIAIDEAGNVLVVEMDGRRIQRFTANGDVLDVWNPPGLMAPWAIASAPGGDLFVVDREAATVHRLRADGSVALSFGAQRGATSALRGPVGVAIGPTGAVFVSEFVGRRVRRFTEDGIQVSSWDADGAGLFGLAVADDDLYMTDARAHRVMRLAGVAGGPTRATPRFEAFTFELAGANPAPGQASLRLGLPSTGHVRVEIIDVSGRRIRMLADASLAAGAHVLAWDGTSDQRQRMPAGVYFARGQFDSGETTRTVLRRVVVIP